MFCSYTKKQFASYNKARNFFLNNPKVLINIEKYLSDQLLRMLQKHETEIYEDYNEANFLYPFWKNYPPDDRGREPRGDQFPWIEVGEHAIGVKIARVIENHFAEIRDTGLPTGPDQRFVIKEPAIKKLSRGLTSHAWLMIDIKSVGPRDDFSHTVMSHNQVSGDGVWENEEGGVVNKTLRAIGPSSSHKFYPSLPPLYVLSDGSIVPTILLVIKPVYKMLAGDGEIGQPLARIDLITIPNGLLLLENPNYLKTHSGLFYPGKDDKRKNPFKVRARVSFSILSAIADWRVRSLAIKESER